MKYKVEYNGQELEFDSENKVGEIKDKIDGTTRTVPIFMVDAVSEDIKSDEEIKKKVDDALLDSTFAGRKGEKGIKFLEDRTENMEKKNKSKKNKDSDKNKLHFVELKILGHKGNGKTGFNPGQWRAVGVLDPKSKGFDKNGKEQSIGAIYLFETTTGEKDKTGETKKRTEEIKERYKGDCTPSTSTNKPTANSLDKKSKQK